MGNQAARANGEDRGTSRKCSERHNQLSSSRPASSGAVIGSCLSWLRRDRAGALNLESLNSSLDFAIEIILEEPTPRSQCPSPDEFENHAADGVQCFLGQLRVLIRRRS
jgi:hypothetical protein